MAAYHPTPPLGGGERPRLPSAQRSGLEHCSGGPVTQAIRAVRGDVPGWNIPAQFAHNIRAMRAAEPIKSRTVRDLTAKSTTVVVLPRHGAAPFLNDGVQFVHGIRALSRAEVETLVEGLIDLLDTMDGDADHEADFVDRRRRRDGAFYTIGCTSDDEPSLSGLMVQSPGGLGDDREFDEAEGLDPIPDWSGHGVHEVSVGRRV